MKFALLGLISAESVNIQSAGAGRGSFSVFYEPPRGATGDQWRNNSRKNEGMEPKQKQCPVVGVTGDRSKV